MNFFNLLPTFSRLSVHTISNTRNISAYTSPLYFRVSDALFGEPLKKKKKLDPAIIKAREERKKKRMEKQIRRLEKVVQQIKPVEEIEVPFQLKEEKDQRLRKLPPLSDEEIESRALLNKEWSRYKRQEYLKDIQAIDSIFYSQQKALDELKAESKELYQEAIQMDLGLLPHTSKGPLKTSVIKNYDNPDGGYTNTTRKFEGEESNSSTVNCNLY